MSSVTVTPLTRSEIEKQESCIYVMNNSSAGNKRPRGVLFMSMKDLDRDVAVEVPATWLPVDLLASASKNAVLNSIDFRRMITNGYLIAISVAQAEAILASPAAQQERERWNATFAEVPGNNPINAALGTESVTIQTGVTSPQVYMPVAKVSKEPSVQFAQLINAFNEGKIADEEASSEITGLLKTGAVSIEQLQMGASSVKNTSSGFYRTIGALISDPESVMGVASRQAPLQPAPVTVTFP